MAEALVIAGFLGLLVVLQVKDQKKIIVAAQTSWIRMGLSIALTVAILVIFWPSNLADQIKLGAFAAIILINGFLKEGLSQEGVVKLGVLNGEFARYPQIQIEELAGGNSFVSFYKSKNNSFSLVFGKSQAELVAALQQLATDSELGLGEMGDEKRPLAKGSAR